MFNYQGITNKMNEIANSLQGIGGNHYNTIFYVTSASGDLVVDDLGNYSVSNLETIEIKARLRESSNPRLEALPEENINRTLMKGYCVDPSSFEGIYKNYLECKILQNNSWVDGRFTFVDAIPSSLEENYKISISTGQKIKGYFERNNDSV